MHTINLDKLAADIKDLIETSSIEEQVEGWLIENHGSASEFQISSVVSALIEEELLA